MEATREVPGRLDDVQCSPWIVLVFALVGCGSPLSSAITAIETGRYADADSELRAIESEFELLGTGQRAEYALYRGLTSLALGDARRAEAWLAAVKAAVDREPKLLSHAEHGRLFAAWRSLGFMPGEPGSRSFSEGR